METQMIRDRQGKEETIIYEIYVLFSIDRVTKSFINCQLIDD